MLHSDDIESRIFWSSLIGQFPVVYSVPSHYMRQRCCVVNYTHIRWASVVTSVSINVLSIDGNRPPASSVLNKTLLWLSSILRTQYRWSTVSITNSRRDLGECLGTSKGLFIWYDLPSIQAWISNHVPYKVWDKIYFPFPNSKGCAIEISELMSKFIAHCGMKLLIYCYGS